MNLCVLIPTYNEEQNIGRVVTACQNQKLDVVVVDDGSSDSTAQQARRAGAFVIRNKENKGKGYSIKEGIEFILSKDYDCVLTMDGDGQHDPQDIPKFLCRLQDDTADLLLGNRMQDAKGMPFLRRVTNMAMSFIISKVAGRNIPDTQCGFRLMRRQVLESSKFASEHFEIESEMILEAAKNNYRIESMPIAAIYRDEKSAINPLVDALRFIKMLLHYLR